MIGDRNRLRRLAASHYRPCWPRNKNKSSGLTMCRVSAVVGAVAGGLTVRASHRVVVDVSARRWQTRAAGHGSWDELRACVAWCASSTCSRARRRPPTSFQRRRAIMARETAHKNVAMRLIFGATCDILSVFYANDDLTHHYLIRSCSVSAHGQPMCIALMKTHTKSCTTLVN